MTTEEKLGFFLGLSTSKQAKKTRAENILFLVLGLVLGLIGNLFASSIVELCNALIVSFSYAFRIGFWITFTIGVSYPLIWILEKFSVALTKLGMEVLDKEDIEEIGRIRRYCVFVFIVCIILLVLTWFIGK
jgi:hypothetical protein